MRISKLHILKKLVPIRLATTFLAKIDSKYPEIATEEDKNSLFRLL